VAKRIVGVEMEVYTPQEVSQAVFEELRERLTVAPNTIMLISNAVLERLRGERP
jgi:hypothetical protein